MYKCLWCEKGETKQGRDDNEGECGRMWREEKEKMWASRWWEESFAVVLLGPGEMWVS